MFLLPSEAKSSGGGGGGEGYHIESWESKDIRTSCNTDFFFFKTIPTFAVYNLNIYCFDSPINAAFYSAVYNGMSLVSTYDKLSKCVILQEILRYNLHETATIV